MTARTDHGGVEMCNDLTLSLILKSMSYINSMTNTFLGRKKKDSRRFRLTLVTHAAKNDHAISAMWMLLD